MCTIVRVSTQGKDVCRSGKSGTMFEDGLKIVHGNVDGIGASAIYGLVFTRLRDNQTHVLENNRRAGTLETYHTVTSHKIYT